MNSLVKCKRKTGGFTLVELLVGIVVGLLTVLAITESFSMFEGRKRTSIGGATAGENGLLASFLIERDARMAGFGLNNVSCTTINAYSATATPADFTLSPLSVVITHNTSSVKLPASATEGTDTVDILYSASPYGSIPALLQDDMINSDAALNVDSGIGFAAGQLVLISQGSNCAILQLSANGSQIAAANITGPGAQWTLAHAPSATHPFNPPATHNIFAAVFTTGASVINLGNLVHRRYYISNNNLMLDELGAAGTYSTILLVNGVVSLKAFYGRDTGTDGYLDTFDDTAPASSEKLVALRIGLLARSGTQEKEPVSASSVVMWPGGPSATGLDTYSRYKNFYTTIPLRNAIWNN